MRDTWPQATGAGAAVGTVPSTKAISAFLDAIRDLEDRVIELEA